MADDVNETEYALNTTATTDRSVNVKKELEHTIYEIVST
jgi:hypothetical protein